MENSVFRVDGLWYLNLSNGGEHETAGPFDDETDAEMARERAIRMFDEVTP